MTEKARLLANRRRTQVTIAVIVAAIALFLAPVLLRFWLYGDRGAVYQPPAQSAPALARAPEATATAWALDGTVSSATIDLPQGPVVIDFAHFNQLDPRGLQPLAAALARRGHATRIWLSDIDPFAVSSLGETPDQSEELTAQLQDASALIVISPFILWSQEEIAVVERFVTDGGRLLLISDPDITGDSAVYTNLLAEPFGIVFNDDYLYDTVRNDRNYTHFFQGEFLDQAAALDGMDVAFYGGRSISGDVTTQARSAATTRSSRRTGVTGFTTVAIGGDRGWDTAGQVLALSDFDVLTEPNVVRHDNQQLVEFVADFLASAARASNLADFPTYLGRDVTLMISVESGLDAETLLTGAQLQRRLEETGRTLALAGAPRVPTPAPLDDTSALTTAIDIETGPVLTGTPGSDTPPVLVLPLTPTLASTPNAVATPTPGVMSEAASPSPTALAAVLLPDGLILLADYDYANSNTSLLVDAGIELVIEYVIPTPQSATPAPTQTPTPTATIATTPAITLTVEPPLVPPLDETPARLPEPPHDVTPLPTLPPITPASQATSQVPVRAQATAQATEQPDSTPEERPDAKPQATASSTPATPAGTVPVTATVTTPVSATVTATVTATASAAVTATVTATETTAATAPVTVTATAPVTATLSPAETPTPTPSASPTLTATPTPVEVTWLVAADGLRLLADETILLLRETTTRPNQGAGSVIVLGASARAIKAGVDRLLANDFSDCILGDELSFCPLAPLPGSDTPPRSATRPGVQPSPGATGQPTPGATPAAGSTVLLIDDNAKASEGESSEADNYLQALVAHGISPVLWSTSGEGIPTADDLAKYKWVIWSNAGYANGQIDVSYLDHIFTYLNEGGRITISSRVPFFGMGITPPAPLRDVVALQNETGLGTGLPAQPVMLTVEDAVVAPLAPSDAEEGFTVALERGPASSSPGQPALISATDQGEAVETGARLVVLGMSLGWLPTDYANQLVANMAEWMTQE